MPRILTFSRAWIWPFAAFFPVAITLILIPKAPFIDPVVVALCSAFLVTSGELERFELALSLAAVTAAIIIWHGTFVFGHYGLGGLTASYLLIGAILVSTVFLTRGHTQARSLQRRIRDIEAELQTLRGLVETSPSGIILARPMGEIVAANRAAESILRSDHLVGRSIFEVFPSFDSVVAAVKSNPLTRASLECRGRKRDGEVFEAHVMFSKVPSEETIGVLFSDAEEWTSSAGESGFADTDRGMASLTNLAAVFDLHEVRNLAWAASASCEQLENVNELAQAPSFSGLRQSLKALVALCSHEIRPGETTGVLELRTFFDELRVIADAVSKDSGVAIELPGAGPPVRVRGNSSLFTQVFLNLLHNSVRALGDVSDKRILVTLTSEQRFIVIRYRDSGPGVEDTMSLFQVSRRGPDYHSVGLYAARAVVRTMGGELRHVRESGSSCFQIELFAADDPIEDRDPANAEIPH